MNLLVWLNLVALAVGTLAGGAFLWRYMRKVPGWWLEEHRAHVIAFSGIVWIFYALYLARTLADPSTGPGLTFTAFNIIRTVLFGVLTCVVVWRWLIFERGLYRARHAA